MARNSFTFKVNDGLADSNIATVSLTVNPVNDAPVAEDQSLPVVEDVATPLTLVGTDIDGDNLTDILLSGPSNGLLSGTGANETYTPTAGYTGERQHHLQGQRWPGGQQHRHSQHHRD